MTARKAIERFGWIFMYAFVGIFGGPPVLIVFLIYKDDMPDSPMGPFTVFIMLELLWLLLLAAAIECRFM